MSIIIGVSGAQGAGKSTLLNELAARGHAVDQFKVSRQVQAERGLTDLKQILASPEIMFSFQHELLERKLEHDLALKNGTGIILTERTFADMAAYTTVWLWKFVDAGVVPLNIAVQQLNAYTTKCAAAQTQVYTGTIEIPLMAHVVFEADPHRASLEDVDAVYYNLVRFLDKKMTVRHARLRINTITPAQRADQAEQFLETLKE